MKATSATVLFKGFLPKTLIYKAKSHAENGFEMVGNAFEILENLFEMNGNTFEIPGSLFEIVGNGIETIRMVIEGYWNCFEDVLFGFETGFL